MSQNDMPKARTLSATVIVTRKGLPDREIPVRITCKTLDRMGLEGARRYERAARNRAAEIIYGRGCWFHSDSTTPHRGQVFTAAKGGGSNAVSVTLTMRVENR